MGVRSLSGTKVKVNMTSTLQNLLNDGVTVVPVSIPSLNYAPPFSNGTGDNQADRAYQISGTLRSGEIVTGVSVGGGGGSGYSSNTLVTFSAGSGIVEAKGHAVIVGGVITSIVIDDPGAGYQAAPLVTITDSGGGSGATATATVATGTDAITLNLGSMTGIDLGAGSGNDPTGEPVDFGTIAGIVVYNTSAMDSPGWLEIQPAASHGWAGLGTLTVANGNAVGPQGMVMRCEPSEAGIAILSGTADSIMLDAHLGIVSYTIYILARDNGS